MSLVPRPLRKLARTAIPESLRPQARRIAQHRGWVAPPPSPDDDPFQYPFWEILAHHPSTYPQYLWGTMCAALLAGTLGYERITVIEFGVAGGNGLLELERIARWVSRRARIGIDVVGFDSGRGLPKPTDYRDLPQLWDEGYFGMDFERLRAELNQAQLVLGPVAQTVPQFVGGGPAPIGFVSFDLDLYSSTTDALAIFRAEESLLLPRVVCYFDDIVGFSHSDFAGERLAISEFNEQGATRKLSQLYGLRHVVYQDRAWTEMMYMLHCFEHARYNDWDGSNELNELPLREGHLAALPRSCEPQ
jgi:hypothetical protein